MPLRHPRFLKRGGSARPGRGSKSPEVRQECRASVDRGSRGLGGEGRAWPGMAGSAHCRHREPLCRWALDGCRQLPEHQSPRERARAPATSRGRGSPDQTRAGDVRRVRRGWSRPTRPVSCSRSREPFRPCRRLCACGPVRRRGVAVVRHSEPVVGQRPRNARAGCSRGGGSLRHRRLHRIDRPERTVVPICSDRTT